MARGLPWRLVTIDIDGTLTTVHGWKVIAEATGRLAAYRETNRRFFDRRSSEDAHLADLLALAEGLTLPELEGILEHTPKLSGVSEGVAELRRLGARVALLSHNPEYVCRWYARRFGFDDFEGCATPPADGGRIGRPGPVRADKRTGLLRLLERQQARPAGTVHVGDGWADIPVFRWAGGGVAVNPDRPEVAAAATVAVRARSFDAVVAAIREMAPRPPLNDVFSADEPINT